MGVQAEPAVPRTSPSLKEPPDVSSRTIRFPRTAGFTSAASLAAALGPEQAAIRLSEPALRALAAPLGVTPSPSPWLSAPAAGAYHLSVASGYNLVGLPPVVAVADGASDCKRNGLDRQARPRSQPRPLLLTCTFALASEHDGPA